METFKRVSWLLVSTPLFIPTFLRATECNRTFVCGISNEPGGGNIRGLPKHPILRPMELQLGNLASQDDEKTKGSLPSQKGVSPAWLHKRPPVSSTYSILVDYLIQKNCRGSECPHLRTKITTRDTTWVQEAGVWKRVGVAEAEAEARIINGQSAFRNRYPWTALVLGIQRRHISMCGGSLVTDRHVVTAGHCLVSAYRYKIVLGAHDRNKYFDMYVIEKHVHRSARHPLYDPTVYDYDVAVMTISPVQFSKQVRTLCLPPLMFLPHMGTAVVAGWGVTHSVSGAQPALLQETNVTVWNSTYCESHSLLEKPIRATIVCGSGRNTDACQGDSGGPMMFRQDNGRYLLVGIVSSGKGCNLKQYPGKYTWVAHPQILGWIEKQIRGGFVCSI